MEIAKIKTIHISREIECSTTHILVDIPTENNNNSHFTYCLEFSRHNFIYLQQSFNR